MTVKEFLDKVAAEKDIVPNLRKMKDSKETSDEVKIRILTEVVANQQAQIKEISRILSGALTALGQKPNDPVSDFMNAFNNFRK